jgi:hypothetical protein
MRDTEAMQNRWRGGGAQAHLNVPPACQLACITLCHQLSFYKKARNKGKARIKCSTRCGADGNITLLLNLASPSLRTSSSPPGRTRQN